MKRLPKIKVYAKYRDSVLIGLQVYVNSRKFPKGKGTFYLTNDKVMAIKRAMRDWGKLN